MDETGIDRETMGRLAKALAFLRSADDPTVVALRQAPKAGPPRTSGRLGRCSSSSHPPNAARRLPR